MDQQRDFGFFKIFNKLRMSAGKSIYYQRTFLNAKFDCEVEWRAGQNVTFKELIPEKLLESFNEQKILLSIGLPGTVWEGGLLAIRQIENFNFYYFHEV